MPRPKRPSVPGWLPADFPLQEALDDYEGDRAAWIFHGERWAFRGSEFEPSLLPHLARICHDFSVPEVLSAAQLFGLQSDWSWPQLWELTVARLVERFGVDEFELQMPGHNHRSLHAVYSALAEPSGATVAAADAALATHTEPDRQEAADLQARLLFADPSHDRFEQVRSLATPDEFDAEAVRAVVTAGQSLGHDMSGWFADALDNGDQWRWVGRRSHLLPLIQAPEVRNEIADELVDRIVSAQPAPWFGALATARLAPHATTIEPLATGRNTTVPHPIWQDFLRWLPTQRFPAYGADTMQAHPFGWLLVTVQDPHETTSGVADQMMGRWGGSPAMVAPPAPAASLGPSFDAPDDAGPGDEPSVARGRVDDRTLGVDVFANGQQLERVMIAGTQTFVEVSIGNDTATFALQDPANIPFGDSDRLRLPVTLVETSLPPADRVTHRATMSVRRDPASSASVEFEVTPRGEQFAALITVWSPDELTAIQAASLTSRVVASDLDEAEADNSFALSLAMVAPPSSEPGQVSASVVHDELGAIAGGDFDITASVDDAMTHLGIVTTSLISGSRDRFATGLPDLIRPALILAAQEGHQLRREFGLAKYDDVERLHVVAVSGKSVLALELVYGGEPPVETAELCDIWFANGTCSDCAIARPEEQRLRVCPDWFWGISKEVEHIRGIASRDFAVHGIPQARQDDPVVVPTNPMLGASNLIIQELVDLGTDLATETASLPGAVTLTADWTTWVDAVESVGPDALIALGHHGTNTFAGTERAGLEIGGQAEPNFHEFHVRRSGDTPGPPVFLIGCDTATSERGLTSFAREFGNWSPLVIATVGEVLVREAALVVEQLLLALQAERVRNGSTGRAVRAARRQLLMDHRLAGLQLVVHTNSSTKII